MKNRSTSRRVPPLLQHRGQDLWGLKQVSTGPPRPPDSITRRVWKPAWWGQVSCSHGREPVSSRSGHRCHWSGLCEGLCDLYEEGGMREKGVRKLETIETVRTRHGNQMQAVFTQGRLPWGERSQSWSCQWWCRQKPKQRLQQGGEWEPGKDEEEQDLVSESPSGEDACRDGEELQGRKPYTKVLGV